MFDELQATLATRRASRGGGADDDEEEIIHGRRLSTGVKEALELAHMRRQNSTRAAEMLQAEKAGNARREKAARDAARSNELEQLFSNAEIGSRRPVSEHRGVPVLQRSKSSGATTTTTAATTSADEIGLQSELEQAFAERKRPLTLRNSSPLRSRVDISAISSPSKSRLDTGVSAPPAESIGQAPAPAAPPSPAADAFAKFLAASEVSEIQMWYDAVLACVGVQSERSPLTKLARTLAPMLPHRMRQLLSALETRAARAEYRQYMSLHGKGARSSVGAVIIGAGPVGLRTAIELALLGCRVEVLEGRERFTRLQVLHLWEWVECDLIELGIKLIDPSIFAASDLRRCQTAQMQHSLFKVALLLGVRVRFGCKIDSLGSLNKLLPASKRIDVLVDAGGTRCTLLDSLGFSQVVCLRSARALCIVMSLSNRKTAEELELRESTWAQQYFQAEFGQLQSQGVVLENLVYYRSTGAFSDAATHYFICTTVSDALHAFGALRSLKESASGLCAADNIDTSRLEAYMRLAIAAFVPELARAEVIPGTQGLTLFDFSERKHSNRAAAAVAGHALGGRQDAPCIVTRVGDALQEPFWPEGLGINRGFLGALDCADLVHRAMPLLLKPLGTPATTVEDFAELLRRREEIFGLTKRISGSNRLTELKAHLDLKTGKFAYTLDPSTRYAAWNKAYDLTLPLQPKTGVSAQQPNSARSKPRMAFHGNFRSPRPTSFSGSWV